MTRTEFIPSIEDELTRAADRLSQAGVSDPRREALSLWAALAGVSLAGAWTQRRDTIGVADATRFRRAVDRRCAGQPLPYAVNSASFRFLELTVDSRVLIPRPETEGLVDLALEWARRHPRSHGLSGLEIGVGSGCIILSLATEGEFTRLVGTDVSAEALDLAYGNLNTVSPDTPVELRRGTFFECLAVAESFDLVISNPPYVTETEFRSLEASVRDHEPQVALVSPHDGMFHIREICRGAAEVLRANGLLLLEIDERRSVPAHELAVEAGFDHVEILQDLFGRDRYLRASKGAVV